MDLTRRAFVRTAGVAVGALVLPTGCLVTKQAGGQLPLPSLLEDSISGRKLVPVSWLDLDIEEVEVHELRMRSGYSTQYYYNAVGRLAGRGTVRRLWGADAELGLHGPREVEFYPLGGNRILIPLTQWGNRVPALYA